MYNLRLPADPFGGARDLSFSDAFRALCGRAIEDHTSLTEAERREVLQRPTQEEEDALCQQQVGLTYDGIVDKALNVPGDMTYQEARILVQGVEARQLQNADQIAATRRLPPDQRQLVETARAAATTDRERRAYEAALPVFRTLSDVKSAANGAMSRDDRRNLSKANMVPWLEHVLGPSAPPVWGFAMICSDYTDDSRWTGYRDVVDNAVRNALLAQTSVGRMEAALAKFTMLYADYPNGSQEDAELSVPLLRQRFGELRSSPQWTSGLHEEVLLYADTAAIESLDTERPFCWALEAEQDPDDPADPNAQGLKLALIQVAPTFYARILQRHLGPPQDETRRRWAPFMGPPTIHHIRSQVYRAEDGIWPPAHQLN